MVVRSLLLFILLILIKTSSFANSVNVHLQGGLNSYQFNHHDNLFLNGFVENKYKTSSNSKTASFAGIGAGYQWDDVISKWPTLVFRANLSAYFIHENIEGTNFPFINGGQFDTLSYTAKDRSTALFLEPTLLYTRYSWQPYILAGIGGSRNRVSHYQERPTDPNLSAVPMSQPFRNKTTTNLAYEIGFGLQHLLYTTKNAGAFNIFFDYRYMNLGDIKLAASPIQTTSHGPELGVIQNQLLSIGLEWKFS